MVSRRDFLKIAGTACGTTALSMAGVESARASESHLDHDRFGVLADFTICVGCRRCEYACSKAHDLPFGELDEYDDQAPMEEMRRPTVDDLTVINAYTPPTGHTDPLTVKVNCMHCEKPNCVSACIVGALTKDPKGPVVYDAWKCIGCRYCMIACPFQIPAYEYEKPLTPKVVKCDLCAESTLGEEKGIPACVEICPVDALTFGKREDLLEMAHLRIRNDPDRYFHKVYGEVDGGGTSWLYLSDRDFSEVDLPELGETSASEVTESIQHGIFRGFSGPAMVFGLMSVLVKSTGSIPPEKDLPASHENGHQGVDHE
jgi:Fe-S-cluster-containing dehydrogenase component|nr:4Fe-4S dicluster domain-containing protein [Candidatus Krumholzibacteria bacterium]